MYIHLVQPRLDLALQLTALGLGAGVALEVADVLDRHLYDLRLLDAAPALPQVAGGDQAAQVGQAVVHPVPPPLLDDPVRQRVLGEKILSVFSFSLEAIDRVTVNQFLPRIIERSCFNNQRPYLQTEH